MRNGNGTVNRMEWTPFKRNGMERKCHRFFYSYCMFEDCGLLHLWCCPLLYFKCLGLVYRLSSQVASGWLTCFIELCCSFWDVVPRDPSEMCMGDDEAPSLLPYCFLKFTFNHGSTHSSRYWLHLQVCNFPVWAKHLYNWISAMCINFDKIKLVVVPLTSWCSINVNLTAVDLITTTPPPPSRYAKIHIPIIASVSEHQPTTWTSFFFDLHILVCIFPAGIWFVMKHLTDERVFRELCSPSLLSLPLSLLPPTLSSLSLVYISLMYIHHVFCTMHVMYNCTQRGTHMRICMSYLFICSGSLCHICCVLCWCDGSPYADLDPHRVCAGSHCYLPLSWQLPTA